MGLLYRSCRCVDGGCTVSNVHFIFAYGIIEFFEKGHEKSLKSHEMSSPNLCGNPVTVYIGLSHEPESQMSRTAALLCG